MNSSEMSMSKTKAKEMFKSKGDRDMATKGGTNPSQSCGVRELNAPKDSIDKPSHTFGTQTVH